MRSQRGESVTRHDHGNAGDSPSARGGDAPPSLRVALAYAHWEGYVKVAGETVLTYVAAQRLPQRFASTTHC